MYFKCIYVYVGCEYIYSVCVRVLVRSPFPVGVQDEGELGEQKAGQEVLVTEGDGELKHAGHARVLHHAGEGRALGGGIKTELPLYCGHMVIVISSSYRITETKMELVLETSTPLAELPQ